MGVYSNPVFAPIDLDHALERLAGGNETEVYRSDDGQRVVKLKANTGGSRQQALIAAQIMRDAAQQFTACLGSRYTIANDYLVACDGEGQARVLVVQPLVTGAVPLFALDYRMLPAQARASIAAQLRDIVARSLHFYRATGSMPDLYGRSSRSAEERANNRSLHKLPERLWSFLIERNLLRSHNLMLTASGAIVLVDYDTVQRSQFYRTVYFTVRWMLFWRDHMLIHLMRNGNRVPGA